MTVPVRPEARLRSAKIIHGSLMAGIVTFLLVTAWLHKTSSPLLGPSGSGTFAIVGIVVLAAVLLVLRVLPSPDAVPAVMQTPAQWGTTFQRMIVRWAVTEGASLANAVMWFVTRDRVSLGAALAGLIVLFFLRPGRDLE